LPRPVQFSVAVDIRQQSYLGVVSAALLPVVAVLVILAVDSWVYLDAKRYANEGRPVVFRSATLVIDSPVTWFVWCLVLWIIFFPLYMVSRA
jgi:hypothetical protein